MAYIDFDKKQLINLSYSLNKELLRVNRKGSYSSTSLIRCNTRKYHGLLVVPQPAIDDELHVLLSTIDPTIIQHDAEFNFGIHQYPDGVFQPKGHKYVRELQSDPIPKITYRVGGVIFSVETLFSSDSDQLLLKYTLEDCNSETTIRLKPFLAYRQRHKLSKANEWVETKYIAVKNGARFKMYQGYSPLYMQFSKEVEYVHVPDWYYNIEYSEERRRGYESQEDLFVPGFFEFSLKKGESVILSASLDEIKPSALNKTFKSELKKRIPRSSFKNCLLNSADQFIQTIDNRTEVVAGFPWFGRWGRDTFISLPGLTLTNGKEKQCKAVLDTMSSELNGPLFPNIGSKHEASYNSIDAPLWFFWAVQKYAEQTGDYKQVWKLYFKKLNMILEGLRNGTDYNIKMHDNGLISGGTVGKALTWMDALSNGKAVTPRIGMPVEINALAYNAIMFTLELAKKFNDKAFIEKWQGIADEFPRVFTETFWDDEKSYLADYVNEDFKSWDVRPNMVFACSLPYSPISLDKRESVIYKIESELLTVKGLRTLSPKNKYYEGHYTGDQASRDKQYHQGTVWPWLMGHFVEGYLKIHGKSGLRKMEWHIEQFEDSMHEHGIGSISEIYDGDPPHEAKGAISQAWSVSEVLRAMQLIEKVKSGKDLNKKGGAK
ncbi:MAG: glycogen debranching enzyme family protein [Bacteroidales bacterium]|nr:glycogen debranching enzyme family protein [Bacteroidales bacterium]